MKYRIEARSLNIAFFSHNFWVLSDENGIIYKELHGLATDRKTGKEIPLGYTKDHSLRAYNNDLYIKGTYSSFYQSKKIVFEGNYDEVMVKWDAADKAVNFINSKDLDYPILGINLSSPTLNSNSVYRTFGEIMGVEIVNFSDKIEPGLDNTVLSQSEIDQFRVDPTSSSPIVFFLIRHSRV